MKERPILFSGPMVRAILEGRKTQTRRVVKPQPIGKIWNPPVDPPCLQDDSGRFHPCPYGYAGDRLWVRETWAHVPATAYRQSEGVVQTISPDDTDMAAVYAADWSRSAPRWRPSIHMPRWASRITLEITGVRVERLQDITTKDAVREGVSYDVSKPDGGPIHRFQKLWNSINKDRAPWESNPWVWVVEFRRLE